MTIHRTPAGVLAASAGLLSCDISVQYSWSAGGILGLQLRRRNDHRKIETLAIFGRKIQGVETDNISFLTLKIEGGFRAIIRFGEHTLARRVSFSGEPKDLIGGLLLKVKSGPELAFKDPEHPNPNKQSGYTKTILLQTEQASLTCRFSKGSRAPISRPANRLRMEVRAEE